MFDAQNAMCSLIIEFVTERRPVTMEPSLRSLGTAEKFCTHLGSIAAFNACLLHGSSATPFPRILKLGFTLSGHGSFRRTWSGCEYTRKQVRQFRACTTEARRAYLTRKWTNAGRGAAHPDHSRVVSCQISTQPGRCEG